MEEHKKPPKKVMPPGNPGGTTSRCDQSSTAAELRRRRNASHRLELLDCRCCRDPHTHRHRGGPREWGYSLAAAHLHDLGLLPAPPAAVQQLRSMWRDGDRELAALIATAWAVTA